MTQLEEAETAFYYLKKTRRRFFTEFLDFLVILIRNMAIAKVNNANLNIWMHDNKAQTKNSAVHSKIHRIYLTKDTVQEEG